MGSRRTEVEDEELMLNMENDGSIPLLSDQSGDLSAGTSWPSRMRLAYLLIVLAEIC